MLPGMMCDARLFAPQIEAFEANYDIIVPSLFSPASIQGMAERILGEVGVQRFNLLGLSMGGIVAMAMAGLAPHRVARLALLDTNHQADAPERRPMRNRQIAAVRNGQLRAVIVDEMKPNYLASRNRGNNQLLGTLIEMAVDLGPDCFVAQSIALRDRPDQSRMLKDYPGSVLILCGAEDTLCPVSRHEDMARLCQSAHLSIIAFAGHMTTLERPAETTRKIAAWLRSTV